MPDMIGNTLKELQSREDDVVVVVVFDVRLQITSSMLVVWGCTNTSHRM
jgi:hypothetical protein